RWSIATTWCSAAPDRTVAASARNPALRLKSAVICRAAIPHVDQEHAFFSTGGGNQKPKGQIITAGGENMKKTIVAITAAAFLGGTAVTLTPAPAHALFPIFLALAKPDANFKASNPYEKKAGKKAKKARR